MRQLVVRLVNRSARPDDSHRGDVIEVLPADHEWGREDLRNPDWLIIKAPMLATDADAMVSRGDRPAQVRRRDWCLDLDNAPEPGRFAWPRQSESVTITRAELAQMLRRKG